MYQKCKQITLCVKLVQTKAGVVFAYLIVYTGPMSTGRVGPGGNIVNTQNTKSLIFYDVTV